jgi:lauroyl/myristoyl acyltransferase
LVGTADLEDALATGHGAILWVGRFTWASIITKMGLAGAGYAVTHLSRPTHGFGTSPFAVRWLNPIWTGIEERFLHERIVMQTGGETAALRALRERLQSNGVVSITVGHEGARVVTVPFLGGTMRLATGPASLAASSGAALLPVFTVATRDCGFRVEIERPLEVPADEAREDREQCVAEGYATRLESWVRRYPGQWLG